MTHEITSSVTMYFLLPLLLYVRTVQSEMHKHTSQFMVWNHKMIKRM